MSTDHYIALAAILFSLGAFGMVFRRNAIVVFMCVELMLNASNLAFVAFARMHANLEGQVFAFFTMVMIFRTRRSASVDEPSLMRF